MTFARVRSGGVQRPWITGGGEGVKRFTFTNAAPQRRSPPDRGQAPAMNGVECDVAAALEPAGLTGDGVMASNGRGAR